MLDSNNIILKKGFTIIEMIVVIAIISMLTGIVTASVQGIVDKAKGTAFRAQVNEFIKAVESYRVNNGGNHPFSAPIFCGQPVHPLMLIVDSSGNIQEVPTNPSNNSPASECQFSTNTLNILSAYGYSIQSKKLAPPFDGAWGRFVFRESDPNIIFYCQGMSTSPDYMITVEGEKNIKYFENWNWLVSGGVIFNNPSWGVKCYSPK